VFREPIATLLLDDKTVGRHYAGPTWEHRDGSAVTGKAVGNAPGATADDIPWLKLEVVNRRGSGALADATTVQRIHTRRGGAQGACDRAGTFSQRPLFRRLRLPPQRRVTAVDYPGSWDSAHVLSVLASPFFGGSGRLLRGGTRRVHHSVLVVGAGRA
jgi:hypothetical protein